MIKYIETPKSNLIKLTILQGLFLCILESIEYTHVSTSLQFLDDFFYILTYLVRVLMANEANLCKKLLFRAKRFWFQIQSEAFLCGASSYSPRTCMELG